MAVELDEKSADASPDGGELRPKEEEVVNGVNGDQKPTQNGTHSKDDSDGADVKLENGDTAESTEPKKEEEAGEEKEGGVEVRLNEYNLSHLPL